MANRDGPLAVRAELGPVRRHRVVQVESPGLDQLVDDDRDVRLARGEQPEQGVRIAPERLVDDHPAVPDHAQLRGSLARLDQVDHRTQPAAVHPDVPRFTLPAELHPASLPVKSSLPRDIN